MLEKFTRFLRPAAVLGGQPTAIIASRTSFSSITKGGNRLRCSKEITHLMLVNSLIKTALIEARRSARLHALSAGFNWTTHTRNHDTSTSISQIFSKRLWMYLQELAVSSIMR
jgi:hypothetical protein